MSSFLRCKHPPSTAKNSVSPNSKELIILMMFTMCISRQSSILALPYFLFLTISATVTSFPNRKFPNLPLPNHVLYQFPNHTWLENLAVRSNGGILVTLLTTPDLYHIDPSQPNASLVHSFPSVLGLSGIAELEKDTFYIAGGNITAGTLNITSQSYSVWEIDMRSFSQSSGALVRKVTDMPEAVFLNGATALSKLILLIADSALGLVWKVNVQTGSYSIAISDPAMAKVVTSPFPLGVNGIKIRDRHLYFTSSNQGLLCRVPISASGNATGEVEVLATGLSPDDFVLDSRGLAWIAQNTANVISVVLRNGTVVDVVGTKDQLTIAGPTACKFGRVRGGAHLPNSGLLKGQEKRDTLYCTTTGGLAAPVNGTVVEGGKVVVIDTEGFEGPR